MDTVVAAVAPHAGTLADLRDRFRCPEPSVTAEAAAASRRERRAGKETTP
jgi:hypothetical protein